MGQRMVVLQASYTGYTNNTATLHVNQMPPNPAIFAPGPALLLVVVKGVPSIGVHVMIGSGHIEEQKPFPVGAAPSSSIIEVANSPNDEPSVELKKSGALGLTEKRPAGFYLWVALWIAVLALFSGGL
jgi:Domain of unknown function (DUF1929)